MHVWRCKRTCAALLGTKLFPRKCKDANGWCKVLQIIGDIVLRNGLFTNTKRLCRSTTNAAYDLEANQVAASNYNNRSATGTAQQVKFEERPDWSDWILFGVGWICGITWIVGALRPLCRRPRFPAARNKAGWIANLICKQPAYLIEALAIVQHLCATLNVRLVFA